MMRGTMVAAGTIQASDVDSLTLTDSPDEAIDLGVRYARDQAGLRLEPHLYRVLGERRTRRGRAAGSDSAPRSGSGAAAR